jgi:putative SOS response-associated peptidase YedK
MNQTLQGIAGVNIRRETIVVEAHREFLARSNPRAPQLPVIYEVGMGRQWLARPFGSSAKILAAVLQPHPSELMEAHEVSTLVNSPENDTAECIQPVSPGQPIKRQLPLL